MILCDTGIIVAALNINDKHYAGCRAMMSALTQPPVTTHACITEAMHLMRNYRGWSGQEALIRWIEADVLSVDTLRREDDKYACTLMRQYADAPMDFADATLVAAAEALGITRILTFDRHFYAYRINNVTPFEVLP